MITQAVSKLARRKQQVWVYLIGALFVADFVFYGYLPSQRRLEALRQSRSEQERMIRMAAERRAELPKLKAHLKDVEEIVSHYEAYVPAEESLGEFLQEIAHIMTDNQLTDQVMVPQAEMECDGIRCIPIQMNCKGSLADVFGFFRDIQAMDRLVRIEKADLRNDTEYTGQVSVNTRAVIFYRPQHDEENAEVAINALQETVTDDS